MDTGEEKISYDSQPRGRSLYQFKTAPHSYRLDAGQIPRQRPGIHNASRYLACCVLTIR